MSHVTEIPGQPTVVLVHGAFADGSSWNGVIERLQAKGVAVTAPADPAARAVRGLRVPRRRPRHSSKGPVIAVGHSYAGAVISNAATRASNVVGARLCRGVRAGGRRGARPGDARPRRTAS